MKSTRMLLILFIAAISACSKEAPDNLGFRQMLGGYASVSSDARVNATLQTLNSDITFASPTASASSVTTAMTDAQTQLVLISSLEDADNADNFLEKKQMLARIINAKSIRDCGFRPQFKPSAPSAPCFGPQLYYANLSGPNCSNMPCGNGNRPPDDLGLWALNNAATGEACLAAQVNRLTQESGRYLGSSVGMIASMQCYARFITGSALPEVGQTKNFASFLNGYMNSIDSLINVNAATLARESDSGGNPVFTSHMTITRETKTVSVTISHSANSVNPALFKGKLNILIKDTGRFAPDTNGFNMPPPPGKCGGSNPPLLAISVLYNKNSSTELLYRLKRALYCNLDANPFNNASKQLDLTVNAGTNPSNGWADNAFDITLKMDPTTARGRFSSAWQAGYSDNATRNFLAELRADGTGVGYFGFGPDISQLENTWSGVSDLLKGMYCNWLDGMAVSGVRQPLVQRQWMTLTAVDNKYKWQNDTGEGKTRIRFAPSDSCDSSGGGMGGYRWTTNPLLNSNIMYNDNVSGNAVTNDLIPVSSITDEIPQLPPRPVDF